MRLGEDLRGRTKKFASAIIRMYVKLPKGREEVRVFSASPESHIYTLADAIAYDSLAHKLIGNFYIKHNKPSVPTKIFPTKEEAIAWLKTFKTE